MVVGQILTAKQHPILICDEAQLLGHPALEQLPLLLNFDMDSSRYLTLLLVGRPEYRLWPAELNA